MRGRGLSHGSFPPDGGKRGIAWKLWGHGKRVGGGSRKGEPPPAQKGWLASLISSGVRGWRVETPQETALTGAVLVDGGVVRLQGPIHDGGVFVGATSA